MPKPDPGTRLVLASASEARARLLANAGVSFEVSPASLDEAELRAGLKAAGVGSDEAAQSLAEMKAIQVSSRFPGRIVLGADQLLDCDGDWLEKPGNRAGAKAQLTRLRDRSHVLATSAVLARDGARLWHHGAQARIRMRDFSDAFLDLYLDRAGEGLHACVGAYQMEGLGVQLFSDVAGDYFTVLGLPLLPVVGALRDMGLLPR